MADGGAAGGGKVVLLVVVNGDGGEWYWFGDIVREGNCVNDETLMKLFDDRRT